MRIAQAAHQVGVSISTLKRLEKRGLIRVRKDRNGQRRYTIDDIQAIQALYYPAAPQPPRRPQTLPTAPRDAAPKVARGRGAVQGGRRRRPGEVAGAGRLSPYRTAHTQPRPCDDHLRLPRRCDHAHTSTPRPPAPVYADETDHETDRTTHPPLASHRPGRRRSAMYTTPKGTSVPSMA